MCTFFIESSKDRSHTSSAKMIDDEHVRPGGENEMELRVISNELIRFLVCTVPISVPYPIHLLP